MAEAGDQEMKWPDMTDDVLRLSTLISAFVEGGDTKALFWSIDEEARIRNLAQTAAVAFQKMDDKEKDLVVAGMIQNLEDGSGRRYERERAIDHILIFCYKQKILSANIAFNGLTVSADFTLETQFDGTKFTFIKENIKDMDYKGVRTLFKQILDNQFAKLPDNLSPHQAKMLQPVEELLLHIIDRKSNCFPALFATTELQRASKQHTHLFPRLTAAMTQIDTSFRPLAEWNYVVGRCFLYPLPYHPTFQNAACAWRIDSGSTTINHRSLLPYRGELSAPQTYLLYMVLKQPRGKDYAMSVMRQNSQQKTVFDDLVGIIILEAMAAWESLPPGTDVPRYQWESIFHLFIYCLTHTYCNFGRLLRVVIMTLKKLQYRRSRAEVMWIIHQFVSSFHTHMADDYIRAVVDIYLALYGDKEETWTGMSSNAMEMTRFLAPACTWITLESRFQLEIPSPSLQTQINFVKEKMKEQIPQDDDAIFAVVANACRNDNECYSTIFCPAVMARIEGSPTDEPFLLSYNRPAFSKLKALPVTLLDSMTLRSKQALSHMCLGLLKVNPHDSRLPSPACIETIVRLSQLLEFDAVMKSFVLAAVPKIFKLMQTEMAKASLDYIFIVSEMLSYRLVTTPTPYILRHTLIGQAFTAIAQPIVFTDSGLYTALEQLALRQWTFLCYADMAQLQQRLFMKEKQSVFLQPHLFREVADSCSHVNSHHPSYYGQPSQIISAHMSPELARTLIISTLRTSKVIGVDLPNDVISQMNLGYIFPKSQLRSFPKNAQDIMKNPGVAYVPTPSEKDKEAEKKLEAALQQPPQAGGQYGEPMDQSGFGGGAQPGAAGAQFGSTQPPPVASDDHEVMTVIKDQVQTEFIPFIGVPDQSLPEYWARLRETPTLLCVVFRLLYETGPQPVPAKVYEMLESLAMNVHTRNLNTLVNYLIFELQTSQQTPDEFCMRMARVLNDMVFVHHLFSFDKLLLSLVLHPTSDSASQWALFILQNMVTMCPEVRERIQFAVHNFPLKSNHAKTHEFFRKLTEFHKKFPEWTFKEMKHRAMNAAQGMVEVQCEPLLHHPHYYGNLVERMIPYTDFLLERALELNLPDDMFSALLQTFAPCYKFHPCPMTFLFTTITCLHDFIGHQPRARQLVLEIIDHVHDGSESPLTPAFVDHNHQSCSPVELVREFEILVKLNGWQEKFVGLLVSRIMAASDFQLFPPPFVSQDWRTAELPPGAQTLYAACVELMASPHPPSVLCSALLQLLTTRPLPHPYHTLNVVALLLTALPPPFYIHLLKEICSVLEHDVNEHTIQEISFDNFEEDCLLSKSNKVSATIALTQAFWHHANTTSLEVCISTFMSDLPGRVRTEKELMFTLHLIVPLMQRCYDAAAKKEGIQQCLNLVKLLYKLIEEVSTKVGPLMYEDTICDLLYHFKYMFVGDFVKAEADRVISRMIPSMREKLKYI